MESFVIFKMKALGYKEKYPGYFTGVTTDADGSLRPANYKSVGRVLKVICNRDFKFYDYAAGKEGDLMDVDYHKIDLFRQMEKEGFDGIIINDFAQSGHYGNYGHISYGFFKNSIKDLTIKQIRNQTHPSLEDWENS